MGRLPVRAHDTGGRSVSLIVIEGLDGSGKSTQARRLVDHLDAAGKRALLTCQPSTGPVGTMIREILAGGHKTATAQSTLALLFAADRLEHIRREVDPALHAGVTVVADRWYHSSLAYNADESEGTFRGNRYPDLLGVAAFNMYARKPDLTIFISARVEVCAERRKTSGRIADLFDDDVTQRRAWAGYWSAIEYCRKYRAERIVEIDGERPPHEVFVDVLRAARGFI